MNSYVSNNLAFYLGKNIYDEYQLLLNKYHRSKKRLKKIRVLAQEVDQSYEIRRLMNTFYLGSRDLYNFNTLLNICQKRSISRACSLTINE